MDANTTRRAGWLGRVVGRTGPALGLASTLLIGSSGCMPQLGFLSPAPVAKGPDKDSFILRADGLVEDKTGPAVSDVSSAELSAGREHFRTGDYKKAESVFSRIAENEKSSPAIVQEAMYYHAESLRMQKLYPEAADHYVALLGKYPTSAYREQCVQQMFTIANYWLDETRQEMKEERERKEGKRWFVVPRFVSFEKSKPLLDREGRTIQLLEQVRLHDINGPLADQALFWCGVVKMYNEDFRDADYYLSQIHARHPESPLAAQSLELAIYCKRMSTGGADYDGRKTDEARKLIQAAMRNYPQIASDPQKRAFLEKELLGINAQQAEKDYKLAEFYRRTDHPASAYFYYELVRRRYPNTTFARLAEERWNGLRSELEKAGKGVPASLATPVAQAQGKPAAMSMDRPIPSTNNQWDRGASPTPSPAAVVPQIVTPLPVLVPTPPVPQ
jgi:TolA-binding protein